ncbi:hypothetical protein CP532_6333 [Ophiocordyceps camponoti-leonardi (nom. inval.)]|nr:hypothetical protein CP532_6333 [Ophiocordyceps camponoti-leonardi (nom. inval.)]
MASRPAMSAGPKKLITYGGLSRSKTSAPSKIRQSRTSFYSTAPRPISISNASLSEGKSVEHPEPDTNVSASSSNRCSTEISANDHGVERKRKRHTSATLDGQPGRELSDFMEADSQSADPTSRSFSTGPPIRDRSRQMRTRRDVAVNIAAADNTTTKNDFKMSTPRRRRLIDALATTESSCTSEAGISVLNESLKTYEREADSTERIHATPKPRSGARSRRSTPVSRKVRLTYSQSRSSLGQSQASDGSGPLAAQSMDDSILPESHMLDGFAEQFRDHTSRGKVAIDVGEEDDVICGFALAAALVIFLTSNSAPHLVRQLTRQGLGRFIGRLLRVDDDIDTYTARHHVKLSRTLTASLHQVKRILMKMPVWHGHAPRHLSPLTVGLRLLETISRCSDGQLVQQVANDLGRDLAIVTANVRTSEDLDYALTVFALEVLSGAGVSMASEKAQVSSSQLPQSIFGFLRTTAQNWPYQRHEVGSAVMKLAINTTNTEDGAAAFDVADLSLLADRLEQGFEAVKEALWSGTLDNGMYDELLLMLGVMINVVEHSRQARASVQEPALDKIAKLWEDNQPTANSVATSKLSVAVNYLAVLLGYLCLTTRGRSRINTQIVSLVLSIRQFVDMNRAVDGRTSELELLATELSRQI